MYFDVVALGIDVVPSASAGNSTMSVSFPEDDTETNKIKLPASLIWKAQSSGDHRTNAERKCFAIIFVAPLRVRSIKETSLTYHEKKNRTSLPVDSIFQKGGQTQQY